MIFIPYGLYANRLFNETTGGSGMPTFKGEPAVVESAIEEPVKTLEELITEI